MMWTQVVPNMMSELKASTELTTLLGGASIYRSRSRPDIQIPSIVWTIVSASLSENYSPVVIQLDVFAHNAELGGKIEESLYRTLHSDLPQQFPSLLMWCQWRNRYDIHDGEQGVWHSAADYVFTPARENG